MDDFAYLLLGATAGLFIGAGIVLLGLMAANGLMMWWKGRKKP